MKEIAAGEKWTEGGIVSFINREIVGSTMRVVSVWEIGESRVTAVEVVSG